MRKLICVLLVSLGSIAPALAEVNFSIGINVPVYPQLVQVPGYPVYYAPQLNANYFFYDGLYWVYDGENWYASQWYNGPWEFVAPEAVPLYILRVPVRYYHRPPGYFDAWSANAPPRWDQHWGRAWAERRRGWDRWNRSAVPPPAPLPTYQRQYAGNRYPRPDQQIVLQSQNYRYWPHDTVAQRYYRTQEAQAPQRQVQPPQYPSERRQYGGPPAAQYAQEAPRGRGYREDRATATMPPASVPPNTGMTPGQQQRLAREQAQ